MRLHNLYKRVKNRLSTRILLFYLIKKLSKKRKHFKALVSIEISLKNNQFIYKNNYNKLIENLLLVNITLPITKLMTKLSRVTI